MPLVKREKSKFWYAQFQVNHRTVVRSTKTTDRKEAAVFEQNLRQEVYAETVLGKKKTIALGAGADRFIESKAGTPNHKNLVSHRKAVASWIDKVANAAAVRNEDLESHLQRRLEAGLARQTIKHELNLVLGSLRYLRRLGYDTADLTCPSIKVANSRLRYLSVEEEERLLVELCPTRLANGLSDPASPSRKKAQVEDNFDLVVILIDTGARYSEIAGLRWSEIDLHRGLIKLWRSKVANESLIFMTKRVETIIANRRLTRSGEYLFSNSKGGARGYSIIAIRKAFQRAGLSDCTVHTLRHTHASRLIQNGMSVYEVKSVLGHADIRTTMRYAHLEQETVTRRARDVIDGIAER